MDTTHHRMEFKRDKKRKASKKIGGQDINIKISDISGKQIGDTKRKRPYQKNEWVKVDCERIVAIIQKDTDIENFNTIKNTHTLPSRK